MTKVTSMTEQVLRDKFRPYLERKAHQGKNVKKMLESLFTHEQLRGSFMENSLILGAREENQTTPGENAWSNDEKIKTTMTTGLKQQRHRWKASALAIVQAMVLK